MLTNLCSRSSHIVPLRVWYDIGLGLEEKILGDILKTISYKKLCMGGVSKNNDTSSYDRNLRGFWAQLLLISLES